MTATTSEGLPSTGDGLVGSWRASCRHGRRQAAPRGPPVRRPGVEREPVPAPRPPGPPDDRVGAVAGGEPGRSSKEAETKTARVQFGHASTFQAAPRLVRLPHPHDRPSRGRIRPNLRRLTRRQGNAHIDHGLELPAAHLSESRQLFCQRLIRRWSRWRRRRSIRKVAAAATPTVTMSAARTAFVLAS